MQTTILSHRTIHLYMLEMDARAHRSTPEHPDEHRDAWRLEYAPALEQGADVLKKIGICQDAEYANLTRVMEALYAVHFAGGTLNGVRIRLAGRSAQLGFIVGAPGLQVNVDDDDMYGPVPSEWVLTYPRDHRYHVRFRKAGITTPPMCELIPFTLTENAHIDRVMGDGALTTAATATPASLRAWRDARALSRRDAGEILGVNERTIETLEYGRAENSVLWPILGRLTEALDRLERTAD